jgi:uncharacterized protein YjbI with pentapeptide repeats
MRALISLFLLSGCHDFALLSAGYPSDDLAGANDLAGVDLAGADLAGADLAGADLARVDLAGSDLAGSDLAGVDLAQVQTVTWTAIGSGSTRSLRGVSGTNGTVFIAEDNGGLLSGTATTEFSRQALGGTLAAVAVSSSEITAPGSVINYYSTVTGSWATTSIANAALAVGELLGEFMVVGDNGLIYYGSLGSFQQQLATVSAPLYGVWGGKLPNGLDEAWYAVGSAGTIILGDGLQGHWSIQTSGTTVALNAIWGTSTADLWVVGNGGTILHSVGNQLWSKETSGTTANLVGVWAIGSDVYAVGAGGLILHSTGNGSWTAEASGTSQSLRAVWGTSAHDVWVVGDAGTLLHKN